MSRTATPALHAAAGAWRGVQADVGLRDSVMQCNARGCCRLRPHTPRESNGLGHMAVSPPPNRIAARPVSRAAPSRPLPQAPCDSPRPSAAANESRSSTLASKANASVRFASAQDRPSRLEALQAATALLYDTEARRSTWYLDAGRRGKRKMQVMGRLVATGGGWRRWRHAAGCSRRGGEGRRHNSMASLITTGSLPIAASPLVCLPVPGGPHMAAARRGGAEAETPGRPKGDV